MLDKKDAQWWILEAQKHPESAADLIRMLADRLAFLDKQNEELRGEVISLRRKSRGGTASTEITSLEKRIQELETALRQTGAAQRFIIYAHDRIEINVPIDAARERGLEREFATGVSLLLCSPSARLQIITTESRAFSVSLTELPVPKDGPTMLGNPRNIAAIVDQSVFEQYRFLTLLSQRGYIYSLLAGTVNQLAKKQEKLIRNLIPDDPIVAVLPSTNADIFAISQRGRWIRFPEKSIAGVGSLVMELPKGDALVGIVPLAAETDFIFLTTDGKIFVRSSSGLAARKAPGNPAGVLFKNQSIFGVTSGSELLILTKRGKVLTIPTSELPYRAQTDTGAAVPGLDADDSIVAFSTRQEV